MEDFLANQPSHNIWLVGGLIGLLFGMFIGEPGIAAIGLAAIITAIAAISIQQLTLQLIIWGVLSAALTILLRGMVPKESTDLRPVSDGEVVKEIPQGYAGEVAYEGSLWRARCQVSDITIPVGEQVHVVGRQGNTLIVIPTRFPDSVH
ncbi:MAG: NfeD family protein [Cyanobacteria bacterium P01_F01_bin.150]